GAEDEREVVAAGGTVYPLHRDLVLDHHIGEVHLEVRRKCRDRRQTREIAVRVSDLVAGKAGERLDAHPGDGRRRDERQEAVLAGEVDLRIRPLDLDDTGDVRVQTGVSRVPRVLARVDRVTNSKWGARGTVIRHFAGTARARADLAVGHVDLEPQHG